MRQKVGRPQLLRTAESVLGGLALRHLLISFAYERLSFLNTQHLIQTRQLPQLAVAIST